MSVGDGSRSSVLPIPPGVHDRSTRTTRGSRLMEDTTQFFVRGLGGGESDRIGHLIVVRGMVRMFVGGGNKVPPPLFRYR